MSDYFKIHLKSSFNVVLAACLLILPALGVWFLAQETLFVQDAWRVILEILNIYSKSMAYTFLTALIIVAISTIGSHWLLAKLYTREEKSIQKKLFFTFSVTHVALATSFVLWFSPSGILFRFLGFEEPLVTSTIKDPLFLGYIFVLSLKGIAFLTFINIGVLKTIPTPFLLIKARSLGFCDTKAFFLCVSPVLFKKTRLAIYTVLVFVVGNVDIATILAPNTPPLFPILVLQMFNNPDLHMQNKAYGGALCIFLTGLVLIGFIELACWSVFTYVKKWLYVTKKPFKSHKAIARFLLNAVHFFTLAGLVLMIIFGIFKDFSFPKLLPTQLFLEGFFEEIAFVKEVMASSLQIAFLTAGTALVLSILFLETKLFSKIQLPDFLLFLPILVPELTISLGLNKLFLFQNSSNFFLMVTLGHFVFVFVYVFLIASSAYENFNQQYMIKALSMKKSYIQALFLIKFKMMKFPLFSAFAIGLTVSLMLYTPTIVLGSGRIKTITTESILAYSNASERIICIYALMQTFLQLVIFVLATYFSRGKTHAARH